MIHYSKNIFDFETRKFREGYLKIEDEKISEISWQKPSSSKGVKDWGSLHIGPASIDLHVHSRGFRESHKETFETLDAACKKGGVSVAACLANTRPRLDSTKMIQEFLNQSKNTRAQMIPFAAVTEDLMGEVDTDWDSLLKLPIAGLSDDGRPIESLDRMKRVMLSLKGKNKLFSLHEENLSLSCGSCLHDSPAASFWGVLGSPSSAEKTYVERDIALMKELRVPLHFAHLSSRESIPFLTSARKAGLDFSAELTPHHGLLAVDEIKEWKVEKLSHFKVCPPVREIKDRDELREAFRSGVIDCFATDHAPHSVFEKDVPIEAAMHGFSSIEWHFSLANELRLQSKMDWGPFYRATAERPAELLGLSNTRGRLRMGGMADFIVFDPEASAPLKPGASLNHNGPWVGRRIRGKIFATWIRGNVAYEA